MLFKDSVIKTTLWFLVILDLFLAAICLFAPERWVYLVHGVTDWADPLGTTRRQGAVWLAFLVFQGIAVFRYKAAPEWLALVAGVRLTEVFSDYVYWWFASDLTWFGHAALWVSSPSNLILGWYLFGFLITFSFVSWLIMPFPVYMLFSIMQ